MKWQRFTGIVSCVLLIVSCFLHWAWYPDIQEYFTGFYSKHNYYGRPGVLLCAVGILGIAFYLVKKAWADRINLVFSGIGMAYAITAYLRYISSYDGFVPDKQAGIQVMIFSAIIHLVMSVILLSMTKTLVPAEKQEQEV
jgi:uncharacterized membrane protein YfhO